MVGLAEVKPGERVFNPMCGSGTLLIEAGLGAEPGAIKLRGCDQAPAALACSAQNAAAAGLAVALVEADATTTGLAESSVDVFLSDPPWGDAVGTHGDNAALYPALLAECARIAAPGARFVLLSHEVRLFGAPPRKKRLAATNTVPGVSRRALSSGLSAQKSLGWVDSQAQLAAFTAHCRREAESKEQEVS